MTDKMTRGEWIDMAKYCLSVLLHSDHNKKMKQTLSEFLNDLETLIRRELKAIRT